MVHIRKSTPTDRQSGSTNNVRVTCSKCKTSANLRADSSGPWTCHSCGHRNGR